MTLVVVGLGVAALFAQVHHAAAAVISLMCGLRD